MSIKTYADRKREIKAKYSEGWLTYAEMLGAHMKLNRDYLKGKGSFILPIVL